MSSVSAIESAIEKLSLAEQKIIALHLGERLVSQTRPSDCEAHDDGIPFLSPLDTGFTYVESVPRRSRRQGRVA